MKCQKKGLYCNAIDYLVFIVKKRTIFFIRNVKIKSEEIKGDTSFVDFFEKFMWDKEFQQSRVLFPIELNGNEIKTSKKWKHLSL